MKRLIVGLVAVLAGVEQMEGDVVIDGGYLSIRSEHYPRFPLRRWSAVLVGPLSLLSPSV